MEKKIRWGIIGCGDLAEFKSGPAFRMVKGPEPAASMRSSMFSLHSLKWWRKPSEAKVL